MQINMFSAIAFFLAFSVCFPVSFPSPPLYFLAYLSLLVVLFSSYLYSLTFPVTYLVFYLLLVISLVLSTLFSGENISITALFGVFISPLFFSVGFFVDQKKFFQFFWRFSIVNSLAIIFCFFWSNVYANGLFLFITPELRMWGDTFFYDWPNYIVMIPILAMYSYYLFNKKIDHLFILNAIAALFTTSRVAILGVGIFFAVYLIETKRYFLISLIAFFAVLYFSSALLLIEDGDQFTNRMLKTGDREYLFSGLIEAFWKRPMLGWGVVSVETVFPETYYSSFHNSFLESAVRGGVLNLSITLGFLVFLWRNFYGNHLIVTGKISKILFFAFIIIVCSTQNYLKHPNIEMILSMIIFGKVRKSETNLTEHR